MENEHVSMRTNPDPTPFEVEAKFRVARWEPVMEAVRGLGGAWGPVRAQCDLYLAHPARDFARTDEALRIRQDGDAFRLTYKGPKLDRATKTRKELELPLADPAAAESLRRIFESLGFRPVALVRKRRREAVLLRANTRFTIALDTLDRAASRAGPPPVDGRSIWGSDADGRLESVERAGAPSHFVEVETMAAGVGDLDAARFQVREFARELGLVADALERRSYLEIVVGSRDP